MEGWEGGMGGRGRAGAVASEWGKHGGRITRVVYEASVFEIVGDESGAEALEDEDVGEVEAEGGMMEEEEEQVGMPYSHGGEAELGEEEAKSVEAVLVRRMRAKMLQDVEEQARKDSPYDVAETLGGMEGVGERLDGDRDDRMKSSLPYVTRGAVMVKER